MSEKSDWEQGYDQAQRRFYEERKILTARIAELEAAQRWIPVSERLPKENAPVLVLTVLGGMFVDFIHGKSVVTGNPDFYELDIEDVTHWMPLPPNPESPNDTQTTQTQTIVYGKESER